MNPQLFQQIICIIILISFILHLLVFNNNLSNIEFIDIYIYQGDFIENEPTVTSVSIVREGQNNYYLTRDKDGAIILEKNETIIDEQSYRLRELQSLGGFCLYIAYASYMSHTESIVIKNITIQNHYIETGIPYGKNILVSNCLIEYIDISISSTSSENATIQRILLQNSTIVDKTVVDTSYPLITKSMARKNLDEGVAISSSSNILTIENFVVKNDNEIHLSRSINYTTIYNNTQSVLETALSNSSHNTITRNSFVNNYINVELSNDAEADHCEQAYCGDHWTIRMISYDNNYTYDSYYVIGEYGNIDKYSLKYPDAVNAILPGTTRSLIQIQTTISLLDMLTNLANEHSIGTIIEINQTTTTYIETTNTTTEQIQNIDHADIDIELKPPDRVFLNRTENIVVNIKNTGNMYFEGVLRIRSISGYLEVLYPTENLTVRVPPGQVYSINVVVRGVKEGEELLVVTISIRETGDKIEKVLKIPVCTLRTIYIEVYAIFHIAGIEISRRPETAEIYLCGSKASHLRDNIHVAEIPNIYKTCTLEIIDLLGSRYTLNVALEDTLSVSITDITLSITFLILSWLLLLPMFFLSYLVPEKKEIIADVSFFSFFVNILQTVIFGLWYFFISFYIMIAWLSIIIIIVADKLFHSIKPLAVRKPQLVVSSMAGRRQGGASDSEKPSSSTRMDIKAPEMAFEDIELLQRLLKIRIRDPPKKEYGEAYAVPAEFKKRLKVKLPDKMYLIKCGAENCVFACGEYAIKIPNIIASKIKDGSRALFTSYTTKGIAMEIVRKEVEKIISLDHNNILKLIDYSIEPPILVYELADGSLEDYETLDLKTSLLIAIHLSEALRYLHSRGLVHGDLKPSNILVSKGIVKVGDLSSITYLLSRQRPEVCTVGYCAPEQIDADLLRDPRSRGCENRIDIYQLANVILTVLGISPLDGSRWSEEEVEERLNKIEIVELRDLLRRMLSMEPWLRPSAEEVEKELVILWKKIFGSKQKTTTRSQFRDT